MLAAACGTLNGSGASTSGSGGADNPASSTASSVASTAGAGGGIGLNAAAASTTTSTGPSATSTGSASASASSSGAMATTGTTSTTGAGGSGGESASSASSSSASSASGADGGADGGAPQSGDCDVDADCASGSCVALTPGGFRVCVVPPVVATSCNSAYDLCCPPTKDCPNNAACYVGPLVPVCAGAMMAPENQCGVDQCTMNVDCAPSQICVPAGTLGIEIRACVSATCKLDADCTAHAGGICAPVESPCCAATSGLLCVYPSHGGCRQTSDCPSGDYCNPNTATGVASCAPGSAVCPQ